MDRLCVPDTFYAKNAALNKNLSFISATGFKLININLDTHMLLNDNAETIAKTLTQIAAANGLKICSTHLPYDYPKPDDANGWEAYRRAVKTGIEASTLMGAECAAIHPYAPMNPDWRTYRLYAERKKAKEFLAPFCEYAHKLKLPLAIENMRGAGQFAPQYIRRFGTEAEDIAALADDLDEGVCWDSGHGNISLQEQYDAITYMGSRLRLVHLNDNHGQDDIHSAPFTGTVNWQGAARALKEINYTGPMYFELSCGKVPEKLRPALAAYIFESAKYFEALTETAK